MHQKAYLFGKLKKHGAMACIMVAVAGGVFFAISTAAESVESQANKLKNEYNQLSQETEDGRTKTKFVREAKPVYEKLQLVAGQPTIDRNIANNKFGTLWKSLALEIPLSGETSNQAKIGPIEESADPALKRPQAVAVLTTITIPQMGVYTDESLMQFIKQMREEFGGVLRVTHMSFTLKPKRPEFEEFMQGGKQPVDAAFEAKWYGLKLIEKPSPKEGAK